MTLYHNTAALATLSSSQTYFCLLKEITAPQVTLEKHFPAHTEQTLGAAPHSGHPSFHAGKQMEGDIHQPNNPLQLSGAPGTEVF